MFFCTVDTIDKSLLSIIVYLLLSLPNYVNMQIIHLIQSGNVNVAIMNKTLHDITSLCLHSNL